MSVICSQADQCDEADCRHHDYHQHRESDCKEVVCATRGKWVHCHDYSTGETTEEAAERMCREAIEEEQG